MEERGVVGANYRALLPDGSRNASHHEPDVCVYEHTDLSSLNIRRVGVVPML